MVPSGSGVAVPLAGGVVIVRLPGSRLVSVSLARTSMLVVPESSRMAGAVSLVAFGAVLARV